MIEYLMFILFGISMGTLTGLIPGLHVNNLAPILAGLAAGSALAPLHAASLIVGMMLTHTFLDFIPSTFLGVPNEDTALSVLPAHKLVLKGRGYEVIKLTALGSLGALIFSAMMAGLLMPVLKTAYNWIKPFMHWVLLLIVLAMLALEKNWRKRLIAGGIFLASGFLGVIVLNTNLVGGKSALMPLLSGIFGMSVLLISMNSKNGIPDQHLSPKPVSVLSNAKPIFTGASAGFITGIIPGVGPAQGTVLT